MTDMNLPVPLDWREIHRRPDNTRTVVYQTAQGEFGVVTFYPNGGWDTPHVFKSEDDAHREYTSRTAQDY